MSFSALYEEIARTISSTYGVPYADVLKACQGVEKSSAGISTDPASPIGAVVSAKKEKAVRVPKGAVPKGAVPKGAVPKDKVPKDTVPKDTVPKDTVPKGKGAAKPEKKVHEVCQHIFQRGKNKDTQCTRAVRDGSDRCSSHGGTSVETTDPVSESHQESHQEESHQEESHQEESHQESDEEVVDKKKSKKKIPNKKP
jgi:hypothetical protein